MFVLYLLDSCVAVQFMAPEAEHLSCLCGHGTTINTQSMTQDIQDRCWKAGGVTSPSVSIQVGGEESYAPLTSHLTVCKMKQISLKLVLSCFFFFLFLFAVLARGSYSARTSYIWQRCAGWADNHVDGPLDREVYVSPASTKWSSCAGKRFSLRTFYPFTDGKGSSRTLLSAGTRPQIQFLCHNQSMEFPFRNVQSLFASFLRGQLTAVG